MGTQRPTPKGAELHPIFSPRLCGHTAAWIKMPLGTEVGLGLRDTEVDLAPGHIVLDGIPAQQPPLFLAHVYCGHGRQSQLLLSSCYDL